MRIGIIGTAGRKEDGAKISKKLYEAAYHDALSRIEDLLDADDDLILISGGAAFADHIAVSLYLAGYANELWLFLPAEFKDNAFVEKGYRSPGSISNYYHRKFSKVMDGNSLEGLGAAIERGAKVYANDKGFHDRNRKVAKSVDYLIAYTFGSGSEPKDGGTAHTYKHCVTDKIHVPLGSLLQD